MSKYNCLSNMIAMQCTVSAIFIALQELSVLWELMCQEHAAEVNESIHACHSTHANILKYMTEITSDCVQSYNILANIKSELTSAKGNRAFDQINLIEIEDNSKKLLAIFKSNCEHSKKIKREIFARKDDISKVKRRMENKDFASVSVSMLLRATIESAAGFLVTAGINKIEFNKDKMGSVLTWTVVGASITGASIIHLNKQCRIKQLFGNLQDLEKNQDCMTTLFRFADDLGAQTTKVVEELQDFTNRVEMNVKYRFQTGDGEAEQVDGIIDRTETLQNSFKDIKMQARLYRDTIRKTILLDSPRFLINL